MGISIPAAGGRHQIGHYTITNGTIARENVAVVVVEVEKCCHQWHDCPGGGGTVGLLPQQLPGHLAKLVIPGRAKPLDEWLAQELIDTQDRKSVV